MYFHRRINYITTCVFTFKHNIALPFQHSGLWQKASKGRFVMVSSLTFPENNSFPVVGIGKCIQIECDLPNMSVNHSEFHWLLKLTHSSKPQYLHWFWWFFCPASVCIRRALGAQTNQDEFPFSYKDPWGKIVHMSIVTHGNVQNFWLQECMKWCMCEMVVRVELDAMRPATTLCVSPFHPNYLKH